MNNYREIPVDGDTFWITLNGLDIEIFFNIYETYTTVFASFYYWDEESIIGQGMHEIKRAGVGYSIKSAVKKATKEAIEELFKELTKEGIDSWKSRYPRTGQKATFMVFPFERK